MVGRNELGDEGATILCDALRESTVTNVQELDVSFNRIGPEGAKAVAAMAAVVASITCLNLSTGSHSPGSVNGIGPDGGKILAEALQSNITMQELSLWGNDIGPEAAELLAKWIAFSGSMRRADFRYNGLGEKGEVVLRKAVEGRSGFELRL